jgi:hypothetical protein
MSSLTPTPALPSGLLAAIAYFLGRVPIKVRTSIYELVILLGGLATYAILAFPHADSFGIHLPARQAAILTGCLTLLAALARSNMLKDVLLEGDSAAASSGAPADAASDPIPAIESTVTDIGPTPAIADPAPIVEPTPAADPAPVPADPAPAPVPVTPVSVPPTPITQPPGTPAWDPAPTL